jgi:hypothetical protein
MSNHTPGPWTFDGEYVESLDLDTPLSIATVADCGNDTHCNGRLIAAAPELLAALKRLVEYCDNHSDYDSIGEACRAIVAAEGRHGE